MSANQSENRTLAAIMFTDLVGYSALAQRNEPLALELLAESQRLLRAQFPLFNGREVKSTGDGFLVAFPSALQATQCAVEIQQTVGKRNGNEPPPRQIRVRIGLHVGEVVHRENDVYGDGVNIAARIEPLATGGGICLSDTVYAQVRNKLDLRLVKLDSPKLKHIEVPMDVYRVVLTGQPLVDVPAPASTPAAPVAPTLAARLAWKTWAPAAILLILLATLVSLMVRHYNEPAKTESAPPAAPAAAPALVPDQKSVAVLPFVNLSADKNDEYLSDGMTEELLNALARVKGLRVPGRASAFAFKNRTGDDIFRQVGSQLHVATVLGGSVRKAGDQLRVTAQLINVADGFCLWSDSYDGDMKDLFALQSQVAKKVAGSLSVELGVEAARELDTPPTINPEAHRQYLLGRFHFDQGSFSGFTAAIPYFQKAVDLDTNYALAYCGMADAYGFTSGILMPGRQGWAKEKALAEKALAIDPGLAEAHFSLGLALASSFHWADGEKEIQRAIAMNTNMAVAYDQYAFLLTCLGRHDEALAMSRRAVELEPLSPLMNIDLGWWLLFARRYDEAVEQCRRAMDLDSHISLGHWALGWSLLWSGDKTNAVMEFERATKLEPQPFFEAPLGYAYAVTGERAKAEQILRDLADSARIHYASPGLQAYPSLGLGETDKVCDWLNQSFEEQDYPCHFLKVDPAFDPLRGDPRFQELLKKARLNP